MKRPLTITFLALMTWSLAYAGSPKIAKDLENRDPNSTVDVIVPVSYTHLTLPTILRV